MTALQGFVAAVTVPTPRTVGGFCDVHAAALILLANMLLDDRDMAEAVVAQALTDACFQPGMVAENPGARHELARSVFRYSTRHGEATATPTGPAPDSDRRTESAADGLRRLAYQQRATIALAVFGDHTYPEVAELLRLPSPTVATLLRSGLQELAAGAAARPPGAGTAASGRDGSAGDRASEAPPWSRLLGSTTRSEHAR